MLENVVVYHIGVEDYSMIILIDGTFGIGKTSVINEIKKQYVGKRKLEVLESDNYFQQYLHKKKEEARRENRFLAIGGLLPQNNIGFLEEYKNVIFNKSQDSIVISDMALTMSECKVRIHDYFETKNMIHIILEADKDTIQKRIKADGNPHRDKRLAEERLDEFIDFLSKNYKNAIRISTEYKGVVDIAKEILDIIDNNTY
ncbi:hypothetical protein [Eshraghiella crossota]|uniref:hypothetical protein n=1 Tax=Eshraghiella crossota TaxID=45851 RepID=UPI004027FB92